MLLQWVVVWHLAALYLESGFYATIGTFWGLEKDWGIRRVAYAGWCPPETSDPSKTQAIRPTTAFPVSLQRQRHVKGKFNDVLNCLKPLKENP
jgi:hypothetical protein